ISQPISNGEDTRLQSVMCVICSFRESRVGCTFGPQPARPTTSMSGSFRWPGPGVIFVAVFAEADARKADPRVGDIAGRSPCVSTDACTPFPNFAVAILTQAKANVPIDPVSSDARIGRYSF